MRKFSSIIYGFISLLYASQTSSVVATWRLISLDQTNVFQRSDKWSTASLICVVRHRKCTSLNNFCCFIGVYAWSRWSPCFTKSFGLHSIFTFIILTTKRMSGWNLRNYPSGTCRPCRLRRWLSNLHKHAGRLALLWCCYRAALVHQSCIRGILRRLSIHCLAQRNSCCYITFSDFDTSH